jgi:hypothetical protein
MIALGDDSASGESADLCARAANAGGRIRCTRNVSRKRETCMTIDRQSVEEKLAELKKLWKKSRSHRRGRFGFYRYLRAVYSWYADLRTTKGSANKARDEIIKLHKLSKKLRQIHPINVMIAATSNDDKRTQSRWARALRYAWRCRRLRQQHRMTLKEFFQKNGGPAGCAAKYSWCVEPNLNLE